MAEMIENGEKVVFIGDASVGKTSLILRYVNNTFSDNVKPTIGCDQFYKDVNVSGVNVKLTIWDTAGQERFRGLTSAYYKNARCIVIVFDITKKSSFDKIDFWRNEIYNYADEGVPIMLIGNNLDLKDKRKVFKEDATSYVNKHNFSRYMETSALENTDGQIEKMFALVAEKVLERIKQEALGLTATKVGKNEFPIKKPDDPNELANNDGCKC